jgi:hypothetical protein
LNQSQLLTALKYRSGESQTMQFTSVNVERYLSFNFGGCEMKRLFGVLALSMLACVAFGCAEETEVKKETTVETPGGTTTTTESTKVEKTGEDPPPAP